MQPISPLFEKIELTQGMKYPKDLRGSIAFTRDTKRVGITHKIIFIAQKIHAFFFGRRDADADINHGLLILGEANKKNKLKIAHGVFSGIRKAARNFLEEANVTELVIYRPIDQSLRDLIARSGEKTAWDSKEPENGAQEKVKFSIPDMIRSFFRVRKSMPDRVIRRVANLTADLLNGDHIKKKNGKARGFFCAAYAMSVLQGGILINAMINKPTGKVRRVAEKIYQWMKDKDTPLGKLFNEHPVFKENARFVMSSYAAQTLDMCT